MLRGTGPGFLNKCGCPVDMATTEFWMYKVTADDSKVPRRDSEDIQSSDFALNPVSLRLIGAAIEAASGLTFEKLLTSRRKRLEATMCWALKEMLGEYVKDEQKVLVERMAFRFNDVMTQVHEMDLSGDEDDSGDEE